MSGSSIPATPRWLFASLVVALLLTLAMPVTAVRASTGLSSGDGAVIANANGDHVRLRSEPGSSGKILGEYSEGTEVQILDGPIQALDGSYWYEVSVKGKTGYMIADYLAMAGEAANDAPANDAPANDEGSEQADDGEVQLASITGSATIVNTGGDRINCRASRSTKSKILGYFSEGDTVSLTGDPSGSWQPVRCAGRNGWVSAEFVSTSASPKPTKTAVAAEATGTGTITGTNGDGARCRTRASTNGSVITVLPEGSSVGVRGSRSGDWMPVVCGNRNGWIWADYVATAKSSENESGGGDTTGTRVIAHTNGDGIRCRKKASLEGEILTVLVAGDNVQLRGAAKGNWQPIYCDGMKGYVYKDYLAKPGDDTGATPVPTPAPSTSLKNGDTAKVSGTNGDGVRFRSAAGSSSSVIMVLSEGTKVDVVKGSTGDWVAVSYRGNTGFVHGDYLVKAASGGSSGGSGSSGSSGGALGKGDHAAVTSSLNFRSGPSTSADVIGIATEGIVVLVTGKADNGYFAVEWGEQDGYMHGDYLKATNDDLSPGFGGVGSVVGDAGSGAATAKGQAMVDYAMKYLGYPYIWATHGPDSFDCSGFTYWVTLHVLHEDIGAGTWTQVSSGTPVSYGNLQPGDLVFFQNTYTWGLSHVGIYIGNNQFIHAENEDTGVRISSLTSTYYSTRWYGAVRLT